MRWFEQNDVLLCREVLFLKPYQFKPGTKESGNSWNLISENLNMITDIENKFSTSQKSVRDRFKLLIDQHKKKMREQENSSGQNFEETELDNLLQNIVDEMAVHTENIANETLEKKRQKESDTEKATEIRQQALETLKETKKRKGEQCGSSSNVKRRNSGSETLQYLQSKSKEEMALRREELKIQKNGNRIPTAATENSSTTSSAAKPNVIFTIGKHEKALVS